MWLTQFFFFLILLAVVFGQSEIGCNVDGECVAANPVGFVVTSSSKKCLESCQDVPSCKFYTVYEDDEICILYSDCDQFDQGSCTNCISGEVILTNISTFNLFVLTCYFSRPAALFLLNALSRGQCSSWEDSVVTMRTKGTWTLWKLLTSGKATVANPGHFRTRSLG